MDSIAKILLRKSRASDRASGRAVGGGVDGGTGGGTGGDTTGGGVGPAKRSTAARAKMEVVRNKPAAAAKTKVPAKVPAKAPAKAARRK